MGAKTRSSGVVSGSSIGDYIVINYVIVALIFSLRNMSTKQREIYLYILSGTKQ